LLVDLDDPHLRNRPFADLGKPLSLLVLEFDVARDLEELRLRVVDVLAHQPQGEEPVTGPNRVAGEGMDLGHDANGRRGHAPVRQPGPVRDLSRHDDRPPVAGKLRGPRDHLEILPSLRAQFEHLRLRNRCLLAQDSSGVIAGRLLQHRQPQLSIPRSGRDQAADNGEREQPADEANERVEHGTLR